MGYFGAHGVAALHKHKYTGVGHSYVAKYVLQPFWSSFVKIFPLWMPTAMCGRATFWFWVISAVPFYCATWEQFWWALQLGKSLPLLSWVPVLNEITTYKAYAVLSTLTFNVSNAHKVVQAGKASMLLALAMGRLVLAHLCDDPKGLKTGMCMSLLYLPFAIANALIARLNDGVPLVDESLVLLGFCAFTVVHEITKALGIYCFRII